MDVKRSNTSKRGGNILVPLVCAVVAVAMIAGIVLATYSTVMKIQSDAWINAMQAVSYGRNPVAPYVPVVDTGKDVPDDAKTDNAPADADVSDEDISDPDMPSQDANDDISDGNVPVDSDSDIDLDQTDSADSSDCTVVMCECGCTNLSCRCFDWSDVANCTLSPDGVWVYNVQRGDTLSHISRLLGFSIDEIAEVNSIKNVNRIYTGESLVIPHRHELLSVDDDTE